MGQLEDMNAFVRIVEAGNISRASEQMRIAKSAVSRRLVELEQRLGTQLLIRTTRQSHLTDAGRDYYKRALAILEDVTDLNSAISSKDVDSFMGNLKVSVPLSFGLQYLAPALHAFTDLHPNLVVQIAFADRTIDIVEEGFDLAIRIAELKDSTLIAKKLIPIRPILCASPAYLKKAGHPKSLEDLQNHAGLFYGQGSTNNFKVLDQENKLVTVSPIIKMIANNGDFLRDVVIDGQGIALLPTFLMKQALEEGTIIQILPEYRGPPLNAYAVYPHTRHLSNKVRAFIDHIKEWLDQNYDK